MCHRSPRGEGCCFGSLDFSRSALAALDFAGVSCASPPLRAIAHPPTDRGPRIHACTPTPRRLDSHAGPQKISISI